MDVQNIVYGRIGNGEQGCNPSSLGQAVDEKVFAVYGIQ